MTTVSVLRGCPWAVLQHVGMGNLLPLECEHDRTSSGTYRDNTRMPVQVVCSLETVAIPRRLSMYRQRKHIMTGLRMNFRRLKAADLLHAIRRTPGFPGT